MLQPKAEGHVQTPSLGTVLLATISSPGVRVLLYASEGSIDYTENFDLKIYTSTGERRSGPAGGCFLGKCPAGIAVR